MKTVGSYTIVQTVQTSRRGNLNTILYKARNNYNSSDWVAIKEHYTPILPLSNELVLQVLSEANRHFRVGQGVIHPHIVKTRELIEHRYIVYDWVQGPQLKDILREKQISFCACVNFITILSSTLRFLTQHLSTLFPQSPSLGHGDIHLENILVTNASDEICPCIIDLCNIGRDLHANRRNVEQVERELHNAKNAIAQSPEYIFGLVDYPDSCSDVFSIGVIAYWLLFACSPFRPGYLSMLRAWRNGQSTTIHPPRRIKPKCDEHVRFLQLLDLMLRFDRNHRLQTMREAELALILLNEACKRNGSPEFALSRVA